MKKQIILLLFIISSFSIFANTTISAKWITADSGTVNSPNTWIAFRKDLSFSKKPSIAITKIAADSKYWLWINGDLIVFEGGLKRGPNPQDTYYDEINLAPYLKKGNNQIAILLWHFGKEGFSHKNSGKAGLLFHMKADKEEYISDRTWHCAIHPAFQNTGEPYPNWRLPESNIRFVASKDIPEWQVSDCKSKFNFGNAVEIGSWGDFPWNQLVLRPIPFWKDFGIKSATFEKKKTENGIIVTASLPYNMQMTPVIDITDHEGDNLIQIETDHLYGGSDTNLRAEYVTSKGHQTYESLGWLNGQKIILKCAKDITINNISYRETGYDAQPSGTFSCDNDFYMRFWEKGLRTLYVNMRDTYFDCPDRERAQWWGDVVVLMGESFYTYSVSAHALMRKAIKELIGWQRNDSTLFSPVPAGNYKDELPAQMLASIGWYGFWNYYMNTGDKKTIEEVYPGVKKYLGIWKLDETGLTELRTGDWSWGDWGDNIDIRLILASWHYLALKAAANMAVLSGQPQDVTEYYQKMERIKSGFNKCWNGHAYRHPSYQKETDDRVQAMAVIAGIAESDKYPRLFELFQTQWHASPYMEKYVMEALFQMGQGKYALERTEKRFANMVNDKEHTTLFEGWEIGGYGGGTTNHAWSGGALTVISQYLCGISPIEAGYKTIRIEPVFSLFKTASITIPTVAGSVESAFSNSDDGYKLDVTIPRGSKAIVYLPEVNEKKILVNGKALRPSAIVTDAEYLKAGKTAFSLSSGKYNITVQ